MLRHLGNGVGDLEQSKSHSHAVSGSHAKRLEGDLRDAAFVSFAEPATRGKHVMFYVGASSIAELSVAHIFVLMIRALRIRFRNRSFPRYQAE